MAGTALDGQLTSAVARDGVRYALATVDDDASIRRLLRHNPIRGAIALSLEREPDYFSGLHLAGADDQTVLAFEGDRLVCMGRCTTRGCWLNGEIRRVSYLGELRLDASAQGRFAILRRGYEFFHALQRSKPADFTFTSIAADNHRARALLERALPGLPRYHFLTEFSTLLLETNPRARVRPVAELSTAGLDELVAFFIRQGSAHQLAAAWTAETLSLLANHRLPLEEFRVKRVAGRIVAAAALWDQRAFRQTVIRGYSSGLAFARPALNALRGMLGQTLLPAPGSTLAHAFLAPLAIARGSEALLPEIVTEFCARAASCGLDFITLGFATGDPRLALLRRSFRHRAYASRLYRVSWPDEPPTVPLDNRPFLPEVALL